VKKLNTATNALAACVNSAGPTSSQCVQLFDCMTPGAIYSSTTACTLPSGATPPADTLQAILSTARNPAKVSMEGIYETAAHDAVFSPANTAIGTDYTLSLNITAGISQATTQGTSGMAIDAAGNVWITEYVGEVVTELNPNGAPLSGFGAGVQDGGGYQVGGGDNPGGIAIDASGQAWVGVNNYEYTVNQGEYLFDVVYVLNQSGVPTLASPLGAGEYTNNGGFSGIAIDPSGNAWVANDNTNPGSLTEYTSAGGGVISDQVGVGPSGVAIDQAGYFWVANSTGNSVSQVGPNSSVNTTSSSSGNGLSSPYGIAVDPSGNVWVANYSCTCVTELLVSNETVVSSTKFSVGGLDDPISIAADAAGNIWAANFGKGTLSELSPSGAALSPSTGFSGAGLYQVQNLAIDPSGNVWVANYPGSVTVFFGAAATTVTLLVTAITQGFTPE